jgi:hypothetical protein
MEVDLFPSFGVAFPGRLKAALVTGTASAAEKYRKLHGKAQRLLALVKMDISA